MSLFQRILLIELVLVLGLGFWGWWSKSAKLALKGYDPVSYFRVGHPIPGKAECYTVFEGREYRFVSDENKVEFEKHPETYLPMYNGYSAYDLADRHFVQSNPKLWSIVDGKLYLNETLADQEKWNLESHKLISKANSNWLKLAAK